MLIVPAAVLVWVAIVYSTGLDRDLSMFPLIGAAFAWPWTRIPIGQYKSLVKREAFPSVLKKYGDDFHLEEKGRFDIRSLRRSRILPSYEKAKFEDYITGTWQRLPVEISEAHFTEKRGSGKRRRTVTTFRGLICRFGMHKTFHGHTIVKPDKGVFNFLGALASTFERVRLEDPEFERQFEVFSTDQIEARYLLTVTFMERVRRLAQLHESAFGGKKPMHLAFYDDRLLIMLPCASNLFEVRNVQDPDHLSKDLAALSADLEQVFSIAETLRINQETRL